MLQSNNLIVFFISFFVTFLAVPLLTFVAFKLNYLDTPDGRLKQQKKAVPYLGGVAIYLGFVTAAVSYYFLTSNFLFDIYFFSGFSLLMLLGLYDDLFVLKPASKFLGQICCSLFLLKSLMLQGLIYNNLMIPFILFWFLSIINAFNLIDVMDGLATTAAISSSVSLLVYSILFNQLNLTSILICFLGSLFAFLYYNKPQAKIYMGDAGSMLLGGILGFLTLQLKITSNFNSFFNIVVIAILILAVPILELLGLIIIRTYKKIPFYLGSPDHFCLYLQKKGWSKSNILLYVIFFSLMFFCLSLMFIFNIISLSSVISLMFILLLFWCRAIYLN